MQCQIANGKTYRYFRKGKFNCRLPDDEADFQIEYEKVLAAYVSDETYLSGTGASKIGRHFTKAISAARGRAAMKNVPFSLLPADVAAIYIGQSRRCALTGMRFDLNPSEVCGKRPLAPSLDRISPALGYVVGNVRLVTQMANLARNEFSDEEFFAMCKAAARLNRERGAL